MIRHENVFRHASRPGILTLFVILLAFFPGVAPALEAPEENPPVYEREGSSRVFDIPPGRKPAPVEWTFHKTADNQHPNGVEQQQMWLMNNARANPPQEGYFLATLDDGDVLNAISAFNVDLDMMQDEFDSYPAQPPGAFDVRLYNAAYEHSLYLISIDGQNHVGQFDRIDAAGFMWNRAGGSVYSYAKSGIYCHAGFNIDWGYGTGGMQDPRGHRMNTMSLKAVVGGGFTAGDFYNVGVAVVPENNPSTNVGPLVVTENFARAITTYPDHYNRFIVGTIWEDLNCNGYYDSGEGEGSVTVTPVGGAFYAVTPPSGGFAMPITSAGLYDVTFTGGGLAFPITRTVHVGALSVLVDMPVSEDSDDDLLLDSYEMEYFKALGVTDGTGDQDQDGLTDAYEFRYLTDPTQKDTEGDRMEDGWEVTYGLNPLEDDSQDNPDGDNFTNLEEFLSGTDPRVYTAPWPGDTNQNGRLEFEDALFCLQIQAGLRGAGLYPIYDMDGDGKTGVEESILILKALSDLP
ncbi:MAG: hypothetical protein JEZ02_00800 [Desulfatibacillum sp.]|nr:hypothetical protein [Desulfatibacillum sp.]